MNTFSDAAEHYEDFAFPQKEAATKLMALLPPSATRILELGCGTGILTRKLRNMYPTAQITAIDIAQGMIDKARNLCPNVRFEVADATEYVTATKADLIVSSSSFQWFSTSTSIFECLRQSLAPSGTICIATFIEGTLHELSESYAQTLHSPLPTLPFWSKNACYSRFAAAGFTFDTGECSDIVIPLREIIDLFRHLHGIGAAPLNRGRPLSPGKIRQIMRTYAQNFGHVATYRVFVGRGTF